MNQDIYDYYQNLKRRRNYAYMLKYGYLVKNLTEILCSKIKYDRNQADDKIAWGLGGVYLCSYSSFL